VLQQQAITGFLAGNVHLVVSGTQEAGGSDPVPGTPFPMLPVFTWTSTGLPELGDATRDFAVHQPVDGTYEAEALAYFADLDPRPPVRNSAALLRNARPISIRSALWSPSGHPRGCRVRRGSAASDRGPEPRGRGRVSPRRGRR
jgi:hypothetical protein